MIQQTGSTAAAASVAAVREPRVFVLEKPKRQIDSRKLAKFGVVSYLFRSGQRASLFDTERCIGQISYALRQANFDPESDYIAIVGDTIATVLTVLQADRLAGRRINLLLYSATRKDYTPRKV